jgi:UDP-3-O-[3-hydroxymyristoyl] glucosamine N-acyltransferase
MYKSISIHECTILPTTVADHVGGHLLGVSNKHVNSIAALDETRPNALSFANGKGLKGLLAKIKSGDTTPLPGLLLCNSSAIKDQNDLALLSSKVPLIIVDHPQKAFVSCFQLFFKPLCPTPGISSKADISPSARIGERVTISAFCSIGDHCVIEDDVTIMPHCTIYANVSIGQGTTVHASVVIREGVRVGRNCVVQPGAIIGADGFGYLPDAQLGLITIPQVGSVVIGNGVDIGANSCVDRGAVGDTIINNGTKIDNIVQIGHNVKIGSFSIVCGSSAIGGSSVIGNSCVLGGRTGVADHVSIPDKTMIAGNSGVDRTITEPGTYRGFPIEKDIPWRRQQASLRSLPGLIKTIQRKEK